MRRVILILLVLFTPLAAWADGMVVPTIAYPATITIPDQQVLISFSDGVERLVIETRFTGAGTNFAWVVPLPSQPIIEEATTGLFPTLNYLFQPKVIHEVPRYYVGILVLLAWGCLLWRSVPSVWNAFVATLLFLFITVALLPGLAPARHKGINPPPPQAVSILNRQIVGVFDTATIASTDSKALERWLHENGFVLPPNANPVIADYVKLGAVFVTAKVRRDEPGLDTSTPHPLSFTFKTGVPVYPTRLTGLAGKSLNVELYYIGEGSASASHFKIASSSRQTLAHPLLQQWFGNSAVVTRLTATLSPADMDHDTWIDVWPIYAKKENRLYSRQGALTTALNWGSSVFGCGLVILCGLTLANSRHRESLGRRAGLLGIGTIAFAGLAYLIMPKIEVKLEKGYRYFYIPTEQLYALLLEVRDEPDCHTIADVRSACQKVLSDPAVVRNYHLANFDNPLVGGKFREEDSPGNYLLRQTNNQVEFLLVNPAGGADVLNTMDLPVPISK
jgi:hypothetical protein